MPELAGPTLVEVLDRWSELKAQRAKLNEQLAEVADQMDRLEPQIIDLMAEDGINSISRNGQTVYLAREFFARLREGCDKSRAIEAMHAAGFDHCLMLSHNTLRALAREYDERGETPPAALSEFVDWGNQYRLRMRGSK